jgi:NTP pyrophosphatase (non-canonical NTP hydrolase)
MADVFIYLLLLANKLSVDLIGATDEKVSRNAERFPVSEAKGRAWSNRSDMAAE